MASPGSKPSRGIDYSKWDKIDYEDSSDGESSADEQKVAAAGGGHPRVTRLNAPARVTRDADGMITIDSTPSAPPGPGRSDGKSVSTDASSNMPSSNTGASAAGKSAGTKPEVVQTSQTTSLVDRLTKNGGKFIDEQTKSQIFWSQDRHEVIVSIEFDADQIKSRDIRVDATGMVPYGERNSAVGGGGTDTTNTCGKVKVAATKGDSGDLITLLEGHLSHKIHLAENEDDIEWEILSEDNKKFVRVILRKAVPMAGVTVWWDQILQDHPKIDLSSIKGRAKQSAGVENAWEEAHRLFKEKVQKGQLQQPNIDESG